MEEFEAFLTANGIAFENFKGYAKQGDGGPDIEYHAVRLSLLPTHHPEWLDPMLNHYDMALEEAKRLGLGISFVGGKVLIYPILK